MKLRIKILTDKRFGGERRETTFIREVNGDNFKEVALTLIELQDYGVPIEKAVKEFLALKSDWNAALRI